MSQELTIVRPDLDAGRATLVPPSSSGFIHLAAEVAPLVIFPLATRSKSRLISRVKDRLEHVRGLPAVRAAYVFEAILRAPGRGRFMDKVPNIHAPRFDVVVMIETSSPNAALGVAQSAEYLAVKDAVEDAGRYVYQTVAENSKSLGRVNETRQGVFLFNYFVAADYARLLGIWEYTAGWFTAKTGLNNSTLLTPIAGQPSDYGVINHARWENLRQILPSLLFRPSFKQFVLSNFFANDVAANPILYKLA